MKLFGKSTGGLRQRCCFIVATTARYRLTIEGEWGQRSGEGPMELLDDAGAFVRSRPTTECAQCGERIYVPEWTEYRDGGRIRHLWACEACGYAFETVVRFAAAA
jgi:hypothetical protein